MRAPGQGMSFPKSWERELETTAKIDLNFHWKSSGLQTETSEFGPDFLFSFLNGAALSRFFKPGRPFPLEIRRDNCPL